MRKPSSLVTRSIEIAGHRTSLRLEPAFWDALKEIASRNGLTINEAVQRMSIPGEFGSRTSWVRVFILKYYMARSKPD